jgi:flagellar FliJ protein
MPRFRFPLEPLLKARRHEERKKQLAVAVLERQRLELEDTLRRQNVFIEAGRRSLADRLQGSIDIDALRTHARATIKAMQHANRLVLEIAGVHKRIETARGELVEATRDRRAVELLRERRFDAWKARIEKAEDADTDELASRAKPARVRWSGDQ